MEESMKVDKWMRLGTLAAFVSASIATSGIGLAQGNGHGHAKHEDDDDRGEHFYKDHDREAIRGWYDEHRNHLPPGLAKKDQLPPGLEKQLVERGTLPPGLRNKIEPCPEDLERRLPPPPPDYAHVVIGGNIVLLNRRTYVVADFFHLEIP
jgi:hypothetical protein